MNNNIETIESIDKSIKSFEQEIKNRQEIISSLNKVKSNLLKVSDICPICYGKKEVYKPCVDRDPYHKSCDDWIKCDKCNGSGKYTV